MYIVGKNDKSVGSFVRAFDIPHHVMDDTDLHPYHTTTRLHLKPFCCFGMYTYLQHNVRAVDVNWCHCNALCHGNMFKHTLIISLYSVKVKSVTKHWLQGTGVGKLTYISPRVNNPSVGL